MESKHIDVTVDDSCPCGNNHTLTVETEFVRADLAEEMEKANYLLSQAAPIGEYQRQLHNFKEAVEDRHELFRRDHNHMQKQLDFMMGDRYKDLYERVSYLESVLLRNKAVEPVISKDSNDEQ